MQINLQLHATGDDIVSFVNDLLERHHLYILATRHKPRFQVKQVAGPIDEVVPKFDDLYVNTAPFCEEELVTQGDVHRSCRTCLGVEIPQVVDGKLRQIAVGVLYDDPTDARIRVWRSAINRLKRKVVRGAWIVNHDLGLRAFNRSIAATPKAVAEAQAGVYRLMAVGGRNEILFEQANSSLKTSSPALE